MKARKFETLWASFAAEQVFPGLSLTDDVEAVAADQDFCGAAAGVVVGSHAEAVGSGCFDR